MIKKLLAFILTLSLCGLQPSFAQSGSNFQEEELFLMEEGESEAWTVNGTFEVVNDPAASGGKALVCRNPVMMTTPDDLPEPPLQIGFKTKKDGYYAVWVRAKAPGLGNDTAFIAFNQDPYEMVGFLTGDYLWTKMKMIYLKEGQNYFNFAYREGGLYLDKFIITNISTYTPNGLGTAPNNEERGEKNLLYPLPPYLPVNEHPRVLLRKNLLPEIRANLTHPQNKAMYDLVLAQAEKEFSCTLENTAKNRDNNCLFYIESNAFLYALNGTKEEGRKAIDGIKEYLRTLKISPGNDDITRDGGYAVFIAAEVYDWCYDQLLPQDKKEILDLCIYHINNMEVGWPPVKQNAITGHGGEAQIMRDLFAFSIAVADDFPEVYEAVAGRIFSEFIPVRNVAYQSYFQNQGDSYGAYRLQWEIYMAFLLDRMGVPGLISEGQRWTAYQLIFRKRPDGNYYKDGDADNGAAFYDVGKPMLAFLAANFYKDGYLKEEFFRCSENGVNIEPSSMTISPVNHLILNDPSIELKSREELPLTQYSGDQMGVLQCRTSWDMGMNSNTFMATMKIPEVYYNNHQHLDSGQFEIYYKGPLAIDSGAYTSQPFMQDGKAVTNIAYGSEHDYNYHKRTIAHNAMLIYDPDEIMNVSGYVNDGGQNRKIKGAPASLDQLLSEENQIGEVLGVDYGEDLWNPAYSYLKGDLTKAYFEKVKYYTRAFVFFNFFDQDYPGALIVFDKLTTGNTAFKKTWLLHMREEPGIDGTVTTAANTKDGYDGKLINQTLLPKANNLLIKKVGGEGNEYTVNGVNFKAVVKDKGDETGKWRVEISPKTPAKTDYFLNVLQVSQNSKNLSPIPAEYCETEDFIGAKIKDRVAFFAKSNGRIAKTTNVSVPESSESLYYCITDLKGGTWNVYKDNKLITSKSVTQKGGVLYFHAEAGAYTLKYMGNSGSAEKDLSFFNNIKPLPERNIIFNYNSLYQSLKHPIREDNGILYSPLEECVSLMGGQLLSKYGENMVEYQEKETKVSVVPFDNVAYIPLDQLSEIFNASYRYDPIGKIVRMKKNTSINSKVVNYELPNCAVINDVTWDAHFQDEHGYLSVDGDPITYWSVQGKNHYIIYELEKEENINGVSIMWNNGHVRKANYEILISKDGKDFVSAFKGSASGTTIEFEDTMFAPVRGKFVKILCNGNNTSEWNAIKEVKIYKE